MTPPAYTVPATLPGLLAPQLRVVWLHPEGAWMIVTVLDAAARQGGVLIWKWDNVVTRMPAADLHLDLRDRLTAAHVAWWARAKLADESMTPVAPPSEWLAAIAATDGRAYRPEALAALVMRLAEVPRG